MKKLAGVAFFLLLFSFLALPLGVFAQDTTNADTRSLVRQQILEARQNRLELQQVIDTANAEKRAEVQAQLTEARKHRVRLFAARLTTRLRAAIARLELLIERIEARLETLSDEGVDVAAIQADVESAKALVEDAKETLSTLEGVWEDMLESDDPREVFMVVKENINSVKMSLIEAHRILVSVIGDIKGLRVGVEDTQE